MWKSSFLIAKKLQAPLFLLIYDSLIKAESSPGPDSVKSLTYVWLKHCPRTHFSFGHVGLQDLLQGYLQEYAADRYHHLCLSTFWGLGESWLSLSAMNQGLKYI